MSTGMATKCPGPGECFRNTWALGKSGSTQGSSASWARPGESWRNHPHAHPTHSFPASRAKLSMLNTVSKIRGQVKNPGYPQSEGLLGECMIRHGKELGGESNFGEGHHDRLSRLHGQAARLREGRPEPPHPGEQEGTSLHSSRIFSSAGCSPRGRENPRTTCSVKAAVRPAHTTARSGQIWPLLRVWRGQVVWHLSLPAPGHWLRNRRDGLLL